jgi:hypothetical protein
MTARAVQVIGLAGPDGSGKSTTAVALKEKLAAEGAAVSSTYGYGCIVCRRAATANAQRARISSGWSRSPWVQIHALVDALEFGVRLLAAVQRARVKARRLRTRRRAGGRSLPVPTIVVTDRSPLDSLVKYDLPSASLPSRCFVALAHRYGAIVVLDAPAKVLAARDRGDHGADDLERVRATFAGWASRLPNAVTMDVTDAPAVDAVRQILSETRPRHPVAAA